MWFLALVGCKPIEALQQPGAPMLVIQPAAVDFGAVRLGETGTASVTLRNEGEVAIAFDGVVASSDNIVVDDEGPFELQPGNEQARSFTWTVASTFDLNEHVDLLVGTSRAATIPVRGSSSWGALAVSTLPVDLGAANLACETWSDLTVRNEGTGDDVLTAISATDPQFYVTTVEGDPLDLPLTLAGGSEAIVRVRFAPVAAEPAEGTLVFDSESAKAFATVEVRGHGRPIEQETMTWTVEHDEAITGIINVNDELVRNDYYGLMPRLEEFLSVFFAALLDGPEPFRVAIVTNLSGQVAGPVEYVDQSFSVDDAVTAAEEMLDGGQLKGDNDQGLETCLNAIARNEEWLLDDKGPWADSNLNLVVINYDMEQSPYDATYYVDRYLLEKSSWDLAVHGIAGDVPGGCQLASGGKGVGAAPAVNLHDATVATGGAYLSICEPSWVGWAETLALRFAARYVLEGSPSLESLEVFVDGTPMSSGWSYDETTHELTFDDPSAPDEGAELRVDYARCD